MLRRARHSYEYEYIESVSILGVRPEALHRTANRDTYPSEPTLKRVRIKNWKKPSQLSTTYRPSTKIDQDLLHRLVVRDR